MSIYLNKPHSNAVLIATSVIALDNLAQSTKIDIPTDAIYERIILRLNGSFEHGATKAAQPKFGGIYNLLKSAAIVRNGSDRLWPVTGVKLYEDNFIRSGVEGNNLNYSDLPDKFTQNVAYPFSGRSSILGGVTVPDAAFALDLRHTAAGNQTYNSLRLHIEFGTLSDCFNQIADTALTNLTVEVWAIEQFHDAQTRKALEIEKTRHAEIIPIYEVKTVTDFTARTEFNLDALGDKPNGSYLSDIVVTQLDEQGNPVFFDDENALVCVTINGFDCSTYPVWLIREMQNKSRVGDLPPNMLLIPIKQVGTGMGGLSYSDLSANTKLEVQANSVEGQTGETQLHVEKNYTLKFVK